MIIDFCFNCGKAITKIEGEYIHLANKSHFCYPDLANNSAVIVDQVAKKYMN